nr:hypothetical protein [Tanacetum cinerariifolium]
MLVHQGEGSGTPSDPHHTPFHESSALPTIADEPASPVRDVSEGEACPTESGFIAAQDRATIVKSSTLPHDLAPRAQEEERVKLKERVKVLEDREGVATKQSRDDALIKGRSINEGEAAAKRISNDSEEIVRVLTSIDAATVLAGGIDVPTGSGVIPTAGPPATVISTGSERIRRATRKKNMRMNEQIARDADVARIHAEEELQGMIDSLDKLNETTTKYLQEYQEFSSELPLEKRIELISDLVKYQEHYNKVEDFIPMGSKEETKRLKRKGLNLEKEQVKKQKSSEEALEIETSTEEKMKEMMQLVPVKDVYVQALQVKHPIIDWKVHTEEWKLYDLSGVHHLNAKDKEIFMLVEKDYLLRKGLALVMISYKLQFSTWKLYDKCGVHQLTSKDKDIFMLVEKDYPLRKGLALVMIYYKIQVENYSQMVDDLVRKIYNIANSPR